MVLDVLIWSFEEFCCLMWYLRVLVNFRRSKGSIGVLR